MKSFFMAVLWANRFQWLCTIIKGNKIQANHIFDVVMRVCRRDIKTASLAAWIYGRYMFSFKQISYSPQHPEAHSKVQKKISQLFSSLSLFIECICQQWRPAPQRNKRHGKMKCSMYNVSPSHQQIQSQSLPKWRLNQRRSAKKTNFFHILEHTLHENFLW